MSADQFNPEWRFREIIPGDMFVDPTHDEFFTTQDVGGLNNALVRETIQNTLDARDPNVTGPVYVRFSFKEITDCETVAQYFNGLKPHLDACQNGIFQSTDLKRKFKFLTIEDYGTIGLEGDPEEFQLNLNSGAKHNFFYFWRNVGRSEKKEGDRGRWGLGKAVFPVVSNIRSFMGFTIRKSDKKAYLMGHSLLKNHTLPDQISYQPYGHYGCYNHPRYPHLALPLNNKEEIKAFSEVFSIFRTDEPGLSIVIPYLRHDITFQRITRAILSEFFFPILADELRVIVEDGDDRYNITKKTIVDTAQDIQTIEEDSDFSVSDFRNLVDFSSWILSSPEDDSWVTVNTQDWSKSPRWSNVEFDKDQLVTIKKRLDQGDRLAFKVPTKVQFKGQNPEEAFFKIFLERDDDLKKSEDHFIRGGLRLSGISSLRQRSLRGMVVVDEDPLMTMLGDAENPAHTEWQKEARGFKDKYEHATYCLYFVINSLKYLPTLILASDNETDSTLLEDFFFLPKSTDENDDPNQKSTRSQTVNPPRKPKPIRIRKTVRGFKIQSTGKGEKINSLVIEMAYDIPRGNPFSRYIREDFDLRNSYFTLSSSGLDNIQKQPNQIHCLIVADDFSLSLNGFDPNRDLVIKTTWSGQES